MNNLLNLALSSCIIGLNLFIADLLETECVSGKNVILLTADATLGKSDFDLCPFYPLINC